MLRMGFIEDVETIMAQIPEGHQTALLSATHAAEAISPALPRRFMKRAAGSARIQSSVTTRPDISQSFSLDRLGMRKTKRCASFPEAEDL